MPVRDLIRPLPGVRRLSLLRQQAAFRGSARYWERNYARGGTSGPGSYNALAQAKAAFLIEFVRTRGIGSVIEFGCGDGNQLALADYRAYIGLDVSRAAIELCQRRFAHDPAKSFFLYDGARFTGRAGVFAADLAISLDVIYHLTETHCPDWRLLEVTRGPNSGPDRADFFTYERVTGEAAGQRDLP